MYSPKIREDLIPELHKQAKARGIRMTILVNEIVEEYLKKEVENDRGKTTNNG